MFSEYEVVMLKTAGAAGIVPVGTGGTILMVHDADPPAYEVEFIDALEISLGTFTVYEGDLLPGSTAQQ